MDTACMYMDRKKLWTCGQKEILLMSHEFFRRGSAGKEKREEL